MNALRVRSSSSAPSWSLCEAMQCHNSICAPPYLENTGCMAGWWKYRRLTLHLLTESLHPSSSRKGLSYLPKRLKTLRMVSSGIWQERLPNLGEKMWERKCIGITHREHVTRQKQRLKTNLYFGWFTHIMSLTTGYNPMRNNYWAIYITKHFSQTNYLLLIFTTNLVIIFFNTYRSWPG